MGFPATKACPNCGGTAEKTGTFQLMWPPVLQAEYTCRSCGHRFETMGNSPAREGAEL